VDYVYRYLTPWEHCVPVRADLGDLMDKVERALYGANEAEALGIVERADRRCRTHMPHRQVAADTLDVLDAYAGALDDGIGPGCAEAWAREWERMREDPSWEMRRL
jgi:hypothetical protein